MHENLPVPTSSTSSTSNSFNKYALSQECTTITTITTTHTTHTTTSTTSTHCYYNLVSNLRLITLLMFYSHICTLQNLEPTLCV